MSKKCYIGLDISDSSIELAYVQGKETVGFSRVLLPEGVIVNGVIVDAEAFIQAVKEVFAMTKPNSIPKECTRHIACILPKKQVYVKVFLLPKDTSGEVQGVDYRKQMEAIVPVPASQLHMQQQAQKKGSVRATLVAAAQKVVIDSYREAFEKAGTPLGVIVTETESFRSALFDLHEGVILVDVGAYSTHVHMYDGQGTILLSFISPVGGKRCLEALQEKMKVSTEEATRLLKDVGFDYAQERDEVSFVFIDVFSRLIKDMKEGITYVNTLTATPITKTIIIGGGSNIPKIDEYLSYQLKQLVTVLDTTASQYTLFGRDALLYIGALGAAHLLAQGEDSIDLLREREVKTKKVEKKKSTMSRKKTRAPLLFAVLLIIGILFVALLYL